MQSRAEVYHRENGVGDGWLCGFTVLLLAHLLDPLKAVSHLCSVQRVCHLDLPKVMLKMMKHLCSVQGVELRVLSFVELHSLAGCH